MPGMDQGNISVSVQLPEGSTLEQTEKITGQVEEILNKIPEKQLIYTSTGNASALGMQNVAMDRASIQFKLVPVSDRSRSTDEVVEVLRSEFKKIKGAQLTVNATDSTSMGGSSISISITGEDLATLTDISDVVLALVKEVEGTRNVTSSLESVSDEYQVKVNNLMAAQYGLTTSQIISAIRVAFEGQVVTQFRTGEDQINVRLQYPSEFRTKKSNLTDLVVTGPTGAKIPLSMVAEVAKTPVPQQIMRTNQAREVQITGDISGRNLTSVTSDIEKKLEGLKLPDGYFVKLGGESADMAESFASLGLAIVLAIALVYMVMASQFESLFHPFIIMFSIPPTFIGVVLGLIVTRQSISITALMGYIMLIGIVVNNAIVLVDYINTLRKEGMDRTEAILKAGPIRLRPILMTTLTTVLAILPLAFGGGEGSEGQAPLAVVVAFGLTFSTLITLILVPVVYTLFEDWLLKKKLRRLEKRQRKQALLGEE
jgi:HAE1 family hydrophobic/amphiphilic exporter-1